MISPRRPPGTPLLAFAQESSRWRGKQPERKRGVEKEQEGQQKRTYQVSGKKIQGKEQREREKEREWSGFQERHTVISECFFALSGCLTRAVGEFYWRIRLVAFLWLLTSQGFGLCLESQWSNRRVCHFVEQPIDCGRGNNAFFFLPWREGCTCCGWSSCTCGCSLMRSAVAIFFGSAAEERTWGFTWAHGRKLNLSVYPEKKSPAKFSLFITRPDLLESYHKYSNLNPNSPKCLIDK